MSNDSVVNDACKMEHILSEELTESVCTFLGHPPTCPHGKLIPRGECCKKLKIEVTPVVTRLPEFEVGSTGKITFIVPSDPSRISKLNSLGISAGSIIKLIQKKPSSVLQIDETTVAIDPEIAKEIYIKKIKVVNFISPLKKTHIIIVEQYPATQSCTSIHKRFSGSVELRYNTCYQMMIS
jgi:DtxR family Mn-dependent transcriptional regulator